MTIIWIMMAAFIILLLLPILFSALYYKKRKGEVLFINQDKVRDPRYFGKAFAALIEKNIGTAKDGRIHLSKEEPYMDGNTQKEYPDTVEKLVICRGKEFHPPQNKEFSKEIYSEGNTFIKGDNILRALYSHGDIVLGNNTEIIRWVDAEGTVAVYDACDLGISATSAARMSIGKNCKFRRLFAPQICLGQYPGKISDPKEGKDERIYRLAVQTDREKNVRYINKEMVNEEGVVDFSVLSWKNVSVTERIIVKGDLRSHKGVRLCEGAIVVGNIFAEQDIVLEPDTCVLGNVFSQGNVYMAKGAAVGKQGTISSVIARGTIQAEPGTFVFGYMSCEKQGEILDEKDAAPLDTFSYLERIQPVKVLHFKDLEDYEGVDQQGYRFHQELEKVVIPEGAKRIPASMFFGCTSLKTVEMPDTVEEIGDFAFADCESLQNLSLSGNKCLKRIGISAFENCRSLKRMDFPASLETLDAAAFAGCESLEHVEFEQGTQLENVGDHCFQRCTKLGDVILPLEEKQEEEGTEV